MKERRFLKKVLQYFLQGVIILAPIILTVYAVTALFTFIDNILPDFAGRFFPHIFGVDELGNPRRIPGIGFVLVVLTVVLIGYVSSSFIVGRMVELFDTVLERTPGIKIIYSTLKDFFEAFAGNKRKFNKAVLVSVQAPDIWQIGFITQQEATQFGLEDHVVVYIPKSYAFTGETYFIKKDRIKPLTDISSADAMKFAISGGVTEIDE